jgi:hypothetical protein
VQCCASCTRATRHEQWLNPNIGRRDLLRALGLGAGAAFAVKAPLARAESASSAQAALGDALGQPAHSKLRPLFSGQVRRLRALGQKNYPHKQGEGHVFAT